MVIQLQVVFGGKSSRQVNKFYNDVNVWHPQTQSWAQMQCTNPPAPRCWHSAVLIQHYMVVFGGFYSNPKEHYFDDVHILDLTTGRWHALHPTGQRPRPRNRHLCAAFDRQIPNTDTDMDEIAEESEAEEAEEAEAAEEAGAAEKAKPTTVAATTAGPAFHHELWIQGGNYFDEPTRRGYFYLDSWVLPLQGASIEDLSVSTQQRSWRKLAAQGSPVPERSHHALVHPSPIPEYDVLLFGGEKRRVRFNDVLAARLFCS
eukprot:TRINITY_DN2370_c0_g1_i5.p1 TRINITY_DN2370_c0_g1~~TRINITY_DN2370_c0_g1_i5.p1  ORF type:complete len:259 (-),score=40.17 TRINITY_DN2370_c0_g1_i5:79-855(-)